MTTTFESIESFYSDNPARRPSPEAGYGVHWQLDGWPGTWRVSYVRDTGEVYAVFQGPTRAGLLPTGEMAVISGTEEGLVLALGTFPVDENAGPRDIYYRGLEAILEGWPEHCPQPNGLEWIMRRLASHQPTQPTPLRGRRDARGNETAL